MKHFVLYLILASISESIYAQTVLTDNLLLEMRKHMYENHDAIDSTTIDYGNLWVRSTFDRQLLDRGDTIKRPAEVLMFYSMSTPPHRHIMYIYENKRRIVNMRQSYSKIVGDLLHFFEQNPEIDERLLPFFNFKTYQVYLMNTKNDQTGKWFDWWHRRDTLSSRINVLDGYDANPLLD